MGPGRDRADESSTTSSTLTERSAGKRRRFRHDNEVTKVSRLVQKKLEAYLNCEKREQHFDTAGVYRTTERMAKYDLAYQVYQRMMLDKRKPTKQETNEAERSLPAIRPKLEKNSRRVALSTEAIRISEHATEIVDSLAVDRLSVLHRYRPHPQESPNHVVNGRVHNYNRHPGSALSTPGYVEYYIREGLQCGKPTISSRLKRLKLKDKDEESMKHDVTPRSSSSLSAASSSSVDTPPQRSPCRQPKPGGKPGSAARPGPGTRLPDPGLSRYAARNVKIVVVDDDEDVNGARLEWRLQKKPPVRAKQNENDTFSTLPTDDSITTDYSTTEDTSGDAMTTSDSSYCRRRTSSTSTESEFSPDTDTDVEKLIRRALMNATNPAIPGPTTAVPSNSKEPIESSRGVVSLQRSHLPSVSSNRSAFSMLHLEGLSWNDELTLSLLEGCGLDGHTDMFSLNSLLDNLTLSGEGVLSGGSGGEQEDASDNEMRIINKLNRMRRRVRWDNVSTTTTETDIIKPGRSPHPRPLPEDEAPSSHRRASTPTERALAGQAAGQAAGVCTYVSVEYAKHGEPKGS